MRILLFWTEISVDDISETKVLNTIFNGKKSIQLNNETPRSKLRGISTKDISNNNAASSGVFTLRENKNIEYRTKNYEFRSDGKLLRYSKFSIRYSAVNFFYFFPQNQQRLFSAGKPNRWKIISFNPPWQPAPTPAQNLT